jgi:hypothetical protein
MRLAASLRQLARQLRWQIEHQARLLSAACGKRSAGTQPPLNRMPAMHGIANGLSKLAAFAWPNPAPDTS